MMMMAALRQVCGTLHASPSQLLFLRIRTITSKIFVKGLAFSTTEDNLAEACSQYGKVVKADIILDRAKKRSKGFGYVTFAEEEDARNAQISMNGKILHGRAIYVDMEPPDKPKKSVAEEATDS